MIHAKNIDAVMEFVNYWISILPYETDGIVIEVNEYLAQEELGFTAKRRGCCIQV